MATKLAYLWHAHPCDAPAAAHGIVEGSQEREDRVTEPATARSRPEQVFGFFRSAQFAGRTAMRFERWIRYRVARKFGVLQLGQPGRTNAQEGEEGAVCGASSNIGHDGALPYCECLQTKKNLE